MAAKTAAAPQMKKEDYLEKAKEEVLISEAYLTALFWSNPEQYAFFPEEKINRKTFLNPVWGFYFGLGSHMYKEGIRDFDDISIMKHVKDIHAESVFDKYGGFETVSEVMEEVEGRLENLDAYYANVKKYRLLSDLSDLFGPQVFKASEKYDYHKFDKESLFTFWMDKVNKLGLDGDARYDEHFLLEGLEDDIIEWSESPDIGLPFYNSPLMSKICTGWDYGNMYIYGGFGGSGKTSLTFNKIIMSCIENQEKLLIIANEQGIKEFKKLLVATALGIKKEYLKRQRLNEGEFTSEENKKLEAAVKWVREFSQNNNKLIAFVFMEDYIIKDVKKIIRHYANRGYKSVLIDTGKPSESAGDKQRWEIFTDDFKELYKMCRPNGGGLNLRMWVNVQLADNALGRRFLDEAAFGDSKKIKNEASVVFMGRNVWEDEYEGGDKALKVFKWVPKGSDEDDNPFSEEEKTDNGFDLMKKEFALKRFYEDKHGNQHPCQYLLLFTPKNRRGTDQKGGQHVLVLQSNFNSNTWYEIGWTIVHNDRNY